MLVWDRRLFLVVLVLSASQQVRGQDDPLAQKENAELAQWPANVHRCVHATNQVRKRGDGSVVGSCSSCDPAQPTCDTGCQDLINRMYWACTEVCLPDGYYFDPNKMLSGCWEENVPSIDINVERCGCNASSRSLSVSLTVLMAIIGATVGWLVLV
jgi:hypothetical protein